MEYKNEEYKNLVERHQQMINAIDYIIAKNENIIKSNNVALTALDGEIEKLKDKELKLIKKCDKKRKVLNYSPNRIKIMHFGGFMFALTGFGVAVMGALANDYNVAFYSSIFALVGALKLKKAETLPFKQEKQLILEQNRSDLSYKIDDISQSRLEQEQKGQLNIQYNEELKKKRKYCEENIMLINVEQMKEDIGKPKVQIKVKSLEQNNFINK